MFRYGWTSGRTAWLLTPNMVRSNHVLGQSHLDLLTALARLFDNRCHDIVAGQVNNVDSTVPDCCSPGLGGSF